MYRVYRNQAAAACVFVSLFIFLSLQFSNIKRFRHTFLREIFRHTFLSWVVGLRDAAGYLPVSGRPATFAYSRARACCPLPQVRDGWAIVFIFFKTIYLPFLMSCLLGDG